MVQLVLHARDGDEGSFEELFKLLSGRMLNHIAGMIGYDEEAARDLLQEVFVRMHGRLSTLKEPEKFVPWMYAIASNLSRDHLRKRKREPVADTEFVERAQARLPDESQSDAIRLVREIVADMPAELKQVFLLKKMGEMTFDGIAEFIGCSSRTAKTRMEKAWNLLERELKSRGIMTK
jgi:RNA polymerase sigma-70 factor (ECF subfamily)